MSEPKIESCPEDMPMLLCTGCRRMVCLAVSVEDRRGGAMLCEACVAKAVDLIDDFLFEPLPEADGGVSEIF